MELTLQFNKMEIFRPFPHASGENDVMRRKAKAIRPETGWRWRLDGDPIGLILLIYVHLHTTGPSRNHQINRSG